MQAAGSIFEYFDSLSDPRLNRGQNHSLYEMVVVALTAAICGANCWADVERFGKAKIDWFKKFLTLGYGIPSHDTFGRVFAVLNSEEFLTCLQNSSAISAIILVELWHLPPQRVQISRG